MNALAVRVSAAVIALVALGVDAMYLLLVGSQGGLAEVRGRVVFFASYVAAAALMSGTAAVATSSRARFLLLIAAGVGLISAGTLGILSIGVPLLLGGVWAVVCAVLVTRGASWPSGQPVTSGIAVAALMLVTLTTGVLLTS